jgi:hypothetical protein
MTKRIRFLLAMYCALRRNAKKEPDFFRRRKSAEHSKKKELDKRKRGCDEKRNGESGRKRKKPGKRKRRLWKRSEDNDNTRKRLWRLESGVKRRAQVSTSRPLHMRRAPRDYANPIPRDRPLTSLTSHEDNRPSLPLW